MTRTQECDDAVTKVTKQKSVYPAGSFGQAEVQKLIDAINFEKNRGNA